MLSATGALAAFASASRWDEVAPEVRHGAKRLLLNWLGCALAGAREPAIERAWSALGAFAGPGAADLIGRGACASPLDAAYFNAMSANALDFDDTHVPTVVHPTAPVAAAALAAAQLNAASGRELLHAIALGVEAACRVSLAVWPALHERGWHMTATCGMLGAAAAAGRVLGLDTQRMRWALGIAATQAGGVNEMLGGMSKSLHIGRAAQGGLMAALLAARNFTSSERAIEAPRGFAHVLAGGARLEAIADGLGHRWELARVACKPYPCALMLHPVIDACLALRAQHGIAPEALARVEVACYPLSRLPAGFPAPENGHESKFSIAHAAAAALVHGRAGLGEFDDEGCRHPVVASLRERVVAAPDPRRRKTEAEVSITLGTGERLSHYVEHATGTLEHPLTDAALEAKFAGLAAPMIGEAAAAAGAQAVWRAEDAPDAETVVRPVRRRSSS